MIKKVNWRTKLPFAVAVVLFTLLSLLYFAPQLSGEVLYQHDVKQYDGMTQEILECREATGEDPQWSGSMFGGMPAYLINVAYPAQLIKIGFSKLTKVVSAPAVFIIFAMLSMWLMLVMMGFNGWVAIAGGLMYGLSTYFFLIIGAGHITKMWALAYAPLMFGGVFIALRGNMLWGASLAALFASLEIGANHPQITYYFGMAILAFWISELYFAIKEGTTSKFAKRSALLVVAAILAVSSNLSPLWYTYEHTPDTIRGGSVLVDEPKSQGGLDMEYATSWSYGRVESLNMLIPNYVGGASMDTFEPNGAVAQALAPYQLEAMAQQLPRYWADQPFSGGPTYLGASVLMLALLGLLMVNGREKWWLLTISVVMILLAWGRHFMWFTELMFKILPGYNKFRTVSMTLVVVEWSAPLLATYALAKMWSGEILSKRIFKRLAIGAGSFLAVVVVLLVGSTALFDFGYSAAFEMLVGAGFPDDAASTVCHAMVDERVAVMQSDALRSLIYAGGVAAVLWLFIKSKLSRGLALALISLMVIADLGGVNKRYLNQENFVAAHNATIRATDADKAIMADTTPGFRVLNLTVSPFNDATTSYFHRSVGGYHGAKLSRYQDLIDYYFTNSINEEVLDMLNTRYLIVGDKQSGKPSPVLRESAFGGAWLIESLEQVESPSEEIATLGTLPLQRVGVALESETPKELGFGDGTIELVEYNANHLKYNYSADSPTTAIFSEIFYDKGWKAYIDGEEAPYFRANYLLRAMALPEGEHTIEWRFRAPRWSLIEGITLISSLIIIAAILAILIKKLYDKRQKIEA